MQTTAQSCHDSLLNRIKELRALKLEQEARINQQYIDLKNSFNIGAVLKESIHHIANDQDTQKNLVKIATTTGSNFLIEKLLGRNTSIRGYISSLLVEKVSDSLIGKWISKL